MLKAAIIIPARYHSTRLPGKMLLAETGKFLVQHVFERAVESGKAQRVVIATDDERIASAAESFGAEAIMTSSELKTGTERVAEAAKKIECDIIVNLQGDEPLMDPKLIDRLIDVFLKDPEVTVASAAYEINPSELSLNPNIVKVVVDSSNNALYFSRSPIPYYREGHRSRIYYGHVGIYAYRRNCLFELKSLDETPLEKAEKLEQLRVLENGGSIRIVFCGHAFKGIDTRDDYEQFVEEWKRKNQD